VTEPCDPTVEACVLEHDVSTVEVAPGVEMKIPARAGR